MAAKTQFQWASLALLTCLLVGGEAFAQRGERAGNRGGEAGRRSGWEAANEGADQVQVQRDIAQARDGVRRRGTFTQDAPVGRSRAREFQRQAFYGSGDSDRAEERRTDRDLNDPDRLRTDRFREFDSNRDERRERARELLGEARDEVSDQLFGGNRAESDQDRDDRRGADRRGDDWRGTANLIRRNWGNGDRNELPFRYGWWDSYRDNWPVYSPYRNARWREQPYYWWGSTPANRLTNWVAFDWSRPNYWEYGPGRNIYYQNDYVYYDGRQVMPVDEYYQYIYDLAHDVPSISEADAEEMEWSPLGVFAVARATDNDSQRVLQLAVNQEGVLSGTYYNRENGHVHPVEGMVDERTQRAAWAFADGEHEATLFETSLYNLTEEESTMMVHFGPESGDSEVLHLIRLKQPSDASGAVQPRSATRELP